MLLVILGAGASYDSVPHFSPLSNAYRNDRPPLANQLFEDRPEFVTAMEQFPECMALIPSLRKPGVIVEQELAKFKDQAKNFPQRLRQLASIQYYLHFALWQCEARWHGRHKGITNHAALLDEIERWRLGSGEKVCFVTFNYDTMLEAAMRQVLRFEVRDLGSYINQQDYTLIKLHGSVNWGRQVDGITSAISQPRHLIDHIAELQISHRYSLASAYPMWMEGGGNVIFPALSIPIEKKDEFACPEDHVEKLRQMLPSVTKVITIGWRATELDFLRILESTLTGMPDLMIVSGDGPGVSETASNLDREQSRLQATFDSGFTGLVTKGLGLLEPFLRERPVVV